MHIPNMNLQTPFAELVDNLNNYPPSIPIQTAESKKKILRLAMLASTVSFTLHRKVHLKYINFWLQDMAVLGFAYPLWIVDSQL